MTKPAAGILFRINPEKCIYGDLDITGNIFSTATRENLIRSGVGPGTRLFALASKADKKRGMLGEWVVTQPPVQEGHSEAQLMFFTPMHRAERTKIQWRIMARLHNAIRGDNLAILQSSDLNDLCKVQSVRVLDSSQVDRLHALYRLSEERRRLNCNNCGYMWHTGSTLNTCPICTMYQSNGEAQCAAYLRQLRNTDGTAVQVFYDRPLWCECRGTCTCGLPVGRCFASRRRYDFIFRYNGRRYIVEYDGDQHFRQMFWHVNREDFLAKQDIDKAKNHGAYISGFTIIRLSNDNLQHITATLAHFLSLERKTPFLGVDDAVKYQHMAVPLNEQVIHRYLVPDLTVDIIPIEVYPPHVGTSRRRLHIVNSDTAI